MTAEGEGVLKGSEKAVTSGESREHMTKPPALIITATSKMRESCQETRVTRLQHACYEVLHVLH